MWALLSARFRTWLLLSVALPLVASLARRVADRIERRRGAPTKVSRALRKVGGLGRRRR